METPSTPSFPLIRLEKIEKIKIDFEARLHAAGLAALPSPVATVSDLRTMYDVLAPLCYEHRFTFGVRKQVARLVGISSPVSIKMWLDTYNAATQTFYHFEEIAALVNNPNISVATLKAALKARGYGKKALTVALPPTAKRARMEDTDSSISREDDFERRAACVTPPGPEGSSTFPFSFDSPSLSSSFTSVGDGDLWTELDDDPL